MVINIKRMKPIDFIFFFGILGAICTAFALYYSWRQNKMSSDKTTRTLNNTTELLQENRLLKEKVETQSDKIDELRKENNELSSKLMDKSLDIYSNLTGNGEKPTLVVNPTNLIPSDDPSIPKYFIVQFIVKNKGKYPMRNMHIRISDFLGRDMVLYGIRHFMKGSASGSGVLDKESEYKNFDISPAFDIGTLSPNVSNLLYRTTYSPELVPSTTHYNVEITWDGGYLYHFITFKPEGEKLILDHWEALFNGKPFKDKRYIKFDLN